MKKFMLNKSISKQQKINVRGKKMATKINYGIEELEEDIAYAKSGE